MPTFFFDSTAIVKRYVNEPGSLWVRQILRPAAQNSIHVARITGIEVISALVRRGRAGSLSPASLGSVVARFRHEFANDYGLVAITP